MVDRAHYDVLDEFGRGGLGRVLRARSADRPHRRDQGDTTTGKQVGAAMIAPDIGISQVRWSSDGERLLIMTNAGAKLWHVPVWHGTAQDLATRLRCALHWRLDGATLVPAAPDPTACR